MMKKIFRAMAYIIAVFMLLFYVFMLYQARYPKVSEDYRMRYMEDGYFADPNHQ